MLPDTRRNRNFFLTPKDFSSRALTSARPARGCTGGGGNGLAAGVASWSGRESALALYGVLCRAHLLLRGGPHGLLPFMRRFLSGSALAYNRRHRRHGPLFQNRSKSIVCEEEGYFTELVRYIHLNPLRAKLVGTLEELDTYPWSGHAVVMGKVAHAWQARDSVLSWFGETTGRARRAYRHYVAEGLKQGRRPELVGGGLLRSRGGWSEVVALRRQGQRELGDERVLGGEEFVATLLMEAEARGQRQLGVRQTGPGGQPSLNGPVRRLGSVRKS